MLYKPPSVWIFTLQIWSPRPIQDMNMSAPILLALWMFISWIRNGKLVSSYWPKFAALRLFVETMPIYKAVATGNRKNKLYRETARSNWKQLSIATMPDYSRITPLIFRYHLPLNRELANSKVIFWWMILKVIAIEGWLSSELLKAWLVASREMTLLVKARRMTLKIIAREMTLKVEVWGWLSIL